MDNFHILFLQEMHPKENHPKVVYWLDLASFLLTERKCQNSRIIEEGIRSVDAGSINPSMPHFDDLDYSPH